MTTSSGKNRPDAESEARALSAAGEAAGSGNLEKVRDILFGSQMQALDRRFQKLEERIVKETSLLRDETKKRLDDLDGYVKREVDSLVDRIRAEQNDRASADKDLGQQLRETSSTIEARISALDEQTSKADRELRQALLDQSKTLGEEIRMKAEELSAALDRESEHLTNDKASRSALASLFMELSMRLNNEFNLPLDE